MSVAARTLPSVDLTSVQERTLTDLVAIGEGTAFPAGLEARLRQRIEREIEPLLPARPLRLWCHGVLYAEGKRFARHSEALSYLGEAGLPVNPATKVGVLVHQR